MADGPVPTITIHMGKPCAECGEGGAVDNGLCLSCTTLALGARPLKSAIGQAVQERFKNSNKANKEGHSVAKSGFAREHLRAFVDRIERLSEEKDALTKDISEVYSEAGGTGFDKKILRAVIRLRRLDKADFQEQEAILSLYLEALGMR